MFKQSLVAAFLSCSAGLAMAGGLGYATSSPWFAEGALTYNPTSQTPGIIRLYENVVATNKEEKNRTGAHFAFGYQRSIAENILLGFDAGWGYYGKMTYESAQGLDTDGSLTTTFSGFDANAFVGYRFTPRFSAYAHAGMGYIRIHAEESSLQPLPFGFPTPRGHVTNWEAVPVLGATLAYHITRNVSAIADWSHLAGNSFSSTTIRSEELFTSIPIINSYQFGVRVNV
ncbi:MAG: hypothetical protein KIT27_04480 [Legionellales bacterium]|nr:hypothetical protein [Legionellales bacterium]